VAQKWLQRILLVNDDGIDAPGIKLLEDVAQQLAHEVWVVAPAPDKSGVANSVSLREPVLIPGFAWGMESPCFLSIVRQGWFQQDISLSHL